MITIEENEPPTYTTVHMRTKQKLFTIGRLINYLTIKLTGVILDV